MSHPAPPPPLEAVCQVIGMYDYVAQNDDELAFLKGQVITVVNKDDCDWWKGELGGREGLFPSNYVKLTADTDPSAQCEYTHTRTHNLTRRHTRYANTDILKRKCHTLAPQSQVWRCCPSLSVFTPDWFDLLTFHLDTPLGLFDNPPPLPPPAMQHLCLVFV